MGDALTPEAQPRLSVVVTVVDGGEALRRCLTALARQDVADPLEVIVPYDSTVAGMSELASEFPGFRFLALGHIATDRPASSHAGAHELFDRRRSAGLAAATADLIAMLEDRSVPSTGWARTLIGLHGGPHAVIGGAIENGVDRWLNWAVYFCDFGRYQPPFTARDVPYVSDVNVSYEKSALEATRSLWQDRYHETTVHWALLRAGERLLLSPDVVVVQVREGLRLPELLRERFHWGRLFAYTRIARASAGHRAALAALSPLLPVLLFVRIARDRFARRAGRLAFARVSPAVLLLLATWSLGELVGYVTGSP